jgi:muramoyltetrapeptide carboxypeptidase
VPPKTKPALIKPPALHAGDTIGIIAPASDIDRKAFEEGCDALRRLGYKPFYFDSIFDKDLYFAGTLDRRVHELEEMFERDEIKAIVCARGGYGCNYLLGKLDLHKVAAHPKIFAGYSDVTCLLTYFTDTCGLVTFHAPMVAKDFYRTDGVDENSWKSAVEAQSGWSINSGETSGVEALIEGTSEGILNGGCLSILAASLGTPYEINGEGTILFLEDVATKPFQVDRMLMQLKLAGKLDNLKGIVFGEMLDCIQTQGQGYTLQEVVLRIVGDLGVPVAYGLRSGHVSRGNITLPFGVRASLNVSAESASLKILESATASAPSATAKA